MGRFTYNETIHDNDTNQDYDDIKEVLMLMNSINNENIKLKKVLSEIITSVSKDNQKCTITVHPNDYEYYSNLLFDDLSVDDYLNQLQEKEKNTSKRNGGLEINSTDKNNISYTSTSYPPCHIYDCNKCPYFEYPFCKYMEIKTVEYCGNCRYFKGGSIKECEMRKWIIIPKIPIKDGRLSCEYKKIK